MITNKRDLISYAVKVLGCSKKAHSWLYKPNKAMGNTVPQAIMHTEEGRKEIEEILGRIEHGIYS